MGEFIELLKRPRRESVIWLDSHNYAGRLLAGGAPPWLEVAAFVAWQRKTQGLLKSSVASLPLAPVVAAWLAARPELRVAMGAKTRSVYPLKVLLADEPLREHLVEMASGMRSAVGGVLALALPSPRAWVALAYRQGHTETVEVSEDEADFRLSVCGRLPTCLWRSWVGRIVVARDPGGTTRIGPRLARLPGRLQRRRPLQVGCRLATSGTRGAVRRCTRRCGFCYLWRYGVRRPSTRDRSGP